MPMSIDITGKRFGRLTVIEKSNEKRLGTFDTLEQAKEARKIAEKEIWGKDLE